MAAVCARRAAVTLHVDMVLATECTTLALELIHAHSREGGGAVVTGSFVVDFVDGDGSVDDLGLNGLFLNDGLDFLVDVTFCVSIFFRLKRTMDERGTY